MNPVLLKDLLGLLRLKRVAAIQVFFVAVLALLVLLTWPQSGILTTAARGQDSLLLSLVLGQIVLLILFVPGLAAVSITAEREQNTLEMLYASRLSPWQIIAGKVGSALAFPLILLVAALPFLGLLSYRGELDWQSLQLAYLVLVLTAIMLALLSLTISVLCRQSSTALVIAYLAVLVLCGGVMVPAQLMLRRTEGLGADVLQYAQSASPIAAALSVLRPTVFNADALRHRLPESWRIFLPFALILIVGCLAILVARLRRAPADADSLGGDAAGRQQRSWARRILVLLDQKKQRRPVGSANPLLAKERRTSNLRSGRWMIRIFYASLVLSLALSAMSLHGGVEDQDLLDGVTQVIVSLQIALIGLVVPSLTSSAISGEIEGDTWESLRMTRLSPSAIFWGKFLPAFFPALLPVAALIPAYAVVCYVNPAFLPHLLRVLPVAAMAVALCAILGLLCSSLVGGTARATVAAYLLTAVLFVMPMFGWWSIGSQLDAQTGSWLCLPSPLVMSLAQLPGAAGRYPSVLALWSTHLLLAGAACALMLAMAWVRLKLLLRRG
jgi:ABC-type transport system involved in multi-copper enzyme maturation permease subunit